MLKQSLSFDKNAREVEIQNLIQQQYKVSDIDLGYNFQGSEPFSWRQQTYLLVNTKD